MKYVAICVALYDYQAQVDDEELSFNADDVLYILENNDPDWYKAQLKVPSAPDGGPIGIIPSNYVEKAKPIGSVKAIYDYQPQSIEEVEFKEDEVLALYENDDPDWFVVEKSNGDIGLAPSNYVEQQEQGATNVEKPLPAVANASPLLAAPTTSTTAAASPVLNRSDSALSWSVHEYDVIKKKKTKSKGNLMVGNGMFCYGSETDKASPVRQFQVNQVLTASIDGKNVHIEMNDAQHSVFDFQTASQSEAKGILTKIESSKTASNAAVGLALPSPAAMTTSTSPVSVHTPAPAPAPPAIEESASVNGASACEPRWAIALFAFKPEADEETYLEEHEQVLITDYISSTDWWTIEHKDGTAGIVPANYVKFQDEYEADLRAEEAEEEKKRSEAAAAAARQAEIAAKEKQQREMEEKERKRKEEEDQREKQRQKEMAELNRQRDLEEKERARQAEVDRRRKMQEEAKQRELDAKRQANLAATTMASPQMGGGSPRRSQIPAPPPPPPPALSSHTASSPSLPTYNQQPAAPKHTDPNKPDPAKVRMWTDRTGAFKVEAQFLSCANGKIRLFKTNGVKIDVPTQKMCIEDLKYIEQETGIKQYEDTNDNIPLAQLNNNSKFSWFDYFKKANLPHSACVEYAGNFDANKLTEQDVERLTHRKMKLLGMSEKHVQRIQRFIETNQAEPPSDNEGARPGGLARPKMKVKKSVTFGAVSYIHEDGDSDNDDDVQWQIQQDEILARQLQEQEQHSGGGSSSLHRRGTGRPTPSHSAPRDVNSSVLTPQQFEPLKPVQAAPVQSPPQQQREITPLAALPVQNNNTAPPPPPKPAFEDDAWAPRAGSSPSVQAATASPAWNAAQRSNTLPANVSSPARQRPTAQLSQQSMVDPQLLAKWGGSPALAAANSRPVPPPPTSAAIATPNNTNFAPLQRSATMQPQTTGFQPQGSMTSLPTMLNQASNASLPTLQPQASMTSLPQTQQVPATPSFVNNGFQQQQQPTGTSFASPSVQQPQFTNNNSSSSLNQYMYNQPSPHVVPLQSVLPPPLAPQLTASSYQSTVSSFGSPQIQPQTTGRNWANATPDNPFGSGALNNPAMMQQQQQPNYGMPPQNTGFVPQQQYGNHTQIDPTDKYAVFKTVNTSTPSVFSNQQQQQQPPQQQRSFYY
ncbi:unnamed protein product [Mucor circinelloides]